MLSGRRSGLTVVVGITAGCLVWATASLAGLTALLAASHLAYAVVRVAGAGYLIWLGATALCRTLPGHWPPAPVAEVDDEPASRGRWRGLRAGFLTNLLNPKVGVFYLSLLPQFLPTGPDAVLWGALLVGIHLGTGLLWYPMLILLVGHVRPMLRRPAVRRWIDRVTAGVLVGLGVKLAAEAR